jgi:outer membrane murein-binding lipoprotein Lpp
MRRAGTIGIAAFVVCMLSACESGSKQPDWVPRMDEMSAKVSALEERLAKLERQTPEGREAAAYEADKARLEQLRAGQREIDGAQKQLCDATGQC